jgi:hypothetical protein
VGASGAWLVSIGEDVRLVLVEYLPELLLISLVLLLFWGIRRGLRRDARSTS